MLKEKTIELCVVDISNMWVYSFSNSMEGAKEKLEDALQRQKEDIETWGRHCNTYPDVDKFKSYLTQAQNKNYKIMTYNEYSQLERKHYLDRPLKEITEDEFHDMLNVLPPLKWCTRDNIEMFCMSEMQTGYYTSQYLHDRRNNKYYTKIVDITDQSTWGNNFLQ